MSLAVALQGLRSKRWAQLCVVNLRIVLGFAFLPASLKKLLGQPFTDPDKTGLFHEFLHAFHAVGGFYQAVGAAQLLAALLLMTQRFATLGAAMCLPMLCAISALCWSSAGWPTTSVVTLMTLGTIGLLAWDYQKWWALLVSDEQSAEVLVAKGFSQIDLKLWQRCGAGIVLLYLLVTAYQGGVYRPRGVELDNPSFYLLPLVTLFPLVTWLVDRRRYQSRR